MYIATVLESHIDLSLSLPPSYTRNYSYPQRSPGRYIDSLSPAGQWIATQRLVARTQAGGWRGDLQSLRAPEAHRCCKHDTRYTLIVVSILACR